MNLGSRIFIGLIGLGTFLAALSLTSEYAFIALPQLVVSFGLFALSILAKRPELPPPEPVKVLTADDVRLLLAEFGRDLDVRGKALEALDQRDDEIDDEQNLLENEHLPDEEDDKPELVNEIGVDYQWVLSPGSTTRTEAPRRAIVMHLHDFSRAWVSNYSLDEPGENDGFDFEAQQFESMAAALRWVGGVEVRDEDLLTFDEGHPFETKAYAEVHVDGQHRVIHGARAKAFVGGQLVASFDKVNFGPFSEGPESDDFLSAYLTGPLVGQVAAQAEEQLAEESPSFIDESGTVRDLSLEEIKHIEGVKVSEGATPSSLNYVLSLDADDRLQASRVVAIGNRVFASSSSRTQPPASLLHGEGYFNKLSEAVDWVLGAVVPAASEEKALEEALYAGFGIPGTLVRREDNGFWVLSDDFEGDLRRIDGCHEGTKAKRAVFTSLQRKGHAFRSAHSAESPPPELIDSELEFPSVGSAIRWVQAA